MRALFVTLLCATLPLTGCNSTCADGSDPDEDGDCAPADSGRPAGATEDWGASPYCEETVTVLGWDEVAPDGTVPSSIRPSVEGAADDTLTWSAGDTTPVHVTSTVRGDPEWVDREEVYPPGGGSLALTGCTDGVRIGLTVTLATDDGALDESFDTAWDGATAYYSTTEPPADGLDLWVKLPTDAVGGTWVPTVDPADYDYLELAIDLTLAGGATDGDLELLGQWTDGNSVAYGHVADVASW